MNKNCLFVHAHERDKAIFFSSVSQFLKEQLYNSVHLTFNRLEQTVYKTCGNEDTIFMPELLKEYSVNLSKEDEDSYNLEDILYYTLRFNDLNNFKYSKQSLFENARRYINFLNELHKERNLDLIISWNDTFMFDSLAKKFAEIKKIPTLFFEAGIFRPNTITLDAHGVNFGNSIPQDPAIYNEIKLDEDLFKEFIKKIKNKNQLYSIKLNKSSLGNLFVKERLLDFFYRNVLYKELNLEVIFEKKSQKFKRKIVGSAFKGKLKLSKNNVNLPNNYIFIPFQVHDDSQIILNSPCIQDMEKLVNVVSEQLNIHNSKNNTDLYAVFKEHPADIGRVDYKKLYQKYKNNEKMIFLTDGDTDTILDKSKAIITVNSTVGIEGLQKYKPVIVLGNAYYDIDQITYSCKNFDQLNEIIHQALKGKLNRRLITQFLYYLRFTYQLEGNWRNGEFNYVQFLKKLKS